MARSCLAARGSPPSSTTAPGSRCSRRSRVADVPLTIAGRDFGSRLVIGTGGFRNLEVMSEALAASGAEMATLALRRVDPAAQGSIVDVLREAGCFLLPNTAGCFTA